MKKENLFEMKINKYPVISSSTLEEEMDQTIVPFLEKVERSFQEKGKDDNTISGAVYEIQNAKGSILISHGFTESRWKYREMIYYFLMEGFNVCILDHRNHGHSRDSDEIGPTHIDSFQDYVEDLNVVVEKELYKLKKPYYLYAHSMGGLIGSLYLHQYKNVFLKAILSSPLLEMNHGDIPYLVAKTAASTLCLAGKGKEYLPGQGTFNASEDFEHSASICYERYLAYFKCQLKDRYLQNNGASCKWILEAFKSCEKILSVCKDIQIPVLLFQAEKDDFVLPGGQDKFISSISDGRLVFVKNSKHEIYLSDDCTMELYLGTIFDFLES